MAALNANDLFQPIGELNDGLVGLVDGKTKTDLVTAWLGIVNDPDTQPEDVQRAYVYCRAYSLMASDSANFVKEEADHEVKTKWSDGFAETLSNKQLYWCREYSKLVSDYKVQPFAGVAGSVIADEETEYPLC